MRESLSDRVKTAARGRWVDLLQELGVPSHYLDGKNHPCPACGGKDRFQFTVRGAGAEYGRFACRGLDEQGGDGFRLVMHVFGLSFPDAVLALANVLGIERSKPFDLQQFVQNFAAEPNAFNAARAQAKADKLQAVFDAGEVISTSNIAGRYLLCRGLTASHWPESWHSPLRHCAALDYWHVTDNQPVKLGAFPALVALAAKPDGSLAGLHRIYLSGEANKLALHHDGEAMPSKKLQTAHDGALSGAACRLYPIGNDGRLALTEGIETALAVHRMTGLVVWACLSTSGLKSFVVPDGVREILIYADNDLPDQRGRNAGKEAAHLLAARLVSEGYRVKVLLPPQAGTDWLDVLNDALNEGKA